MRREDTSFLFDSKDADGLYAPIPEEIHDRMRFILMNASENAAEVYDRRPDDSEGYWRCDNALVREMTEEEYGDLCIEILESGDPEEVRKIVRGVAEALRDCDIPWTCTPEVSMEFRRRYADIIEKRFEDGDIEKLFSDFERCDRIVRRDTYF